MSRLHPSAIRYELKRLIVDTASTHPDLSQRLKDLERWIAKKKDGLLTNKKLVIDFLMEFIVDAGLWLRFQDATVEEQQQILKEMSPVEEYWYVVLFSAWLKEPDPKVETWKMKLMSGELRKNDEKIINHLANEIERLGGHTLWRHILDLSMATDLMIDTISADSLSTPLCVQITTVSAQWSAEKREHWELALRYWQIKRGLFLSFNPLGKARNMTDLAEFVLQKGDDLPHTCYVDCNLE